MTKEKIKTAFLKCLPMLIVLVSTGLFMFAIKLVIGIFYEPKDTVYVKEYGNDKFTVIQCSPMTKASTKAWPRSTTVCI